MTVDDITIETVQMFVWQILANMSSPAFVDWVRTRISTNQTHPIEYYNPQPGETNIADGGTCHLGVLAPDGGVVSATSTINLGSVCGLFREIIYCCF